MDNLGGSTSRDTAKKKRTILLRYRRPQNDSQLPPDGLDTPSRSSTPTSGSVSKTSSSENAGHSDLAEADNMVGSYTSGHPGLTSDAPGNDNKLKKLKLKVGGVTRTIHTNSVVGSSSARSSSFSEVPQPYNKDGDYGGLRGIPWKDFSKTGFNVRRSDSSAGNLCKEIASNQRDKCEPASKSKRAPKARILIDGYDEGYDDDDEIRYLEKLKTSKFAVNYDQEDDDVDEVGSRKQRKISKVMKIAGRYNADQGLHSLRQSKESKKFRSGTVSQDSNYAEEEESMSDVDLEHRKTKKQRKETSDTSGDNKSEMVITTRQRALQSGKSSSSSPSILDFPTGLPPAPPKKQKEKLSEVEQLLKRAEAAQRRRMQAEKAARESEAEAIRKILGQDSSRKKREDKIKKRQQELEKERNASLAAPPSNAVRWVMGPTGTVVTFPNEIGLPSIFEPKQCSYPPPREKCAGPSCTNTYKYRDSKSKLPLCSLHCYKALHEKMQPQTAC